MANLAFRGLRAETEAAVSREAVAGTAEGTDSEGDTTGDGGGEDGGGGDDVADGDDGADDGVAPAGDGRRDGCARDGWPDGPPPLPCAGPPGRPGPVIEGAWTGWWLGANNSAAA